jgi:hypothetical protein
MACARSRFVWLTSPFKPSDVRAQTLAHRRAGTRQTGLLRRQPLDQLPTTCQDGVQRLCLHIRQGPRLRSHDFGNMRQRLRVQGIGVGQFPRRLRKIPHLAGIDHDHRHPSRSQGPREGEPYQRDL